MKNTTDVDGFRSGAASDALIPADARHPLSEGVFRRIASSLLLYPRYRLLWTSNLFFFAGVWTQTLVLGWYVFELTHSEFSVAIFTAARLAPMMLGPMSGVISDRFNRVSVLLIAAGWAFFMMALLAGLVYLELVPLWGLILGGFCIGMAQSPSQPTRFALVAELVGRESLSNANALNSIVVNMTQVIGPALGGAMIAIFGVAAALWISAFWYLFSFAALWPLRKVLTVHERHYSSSPLGAFIMGGIRAVFSNRLAIAVLLITFCANILIWPIYHGFMPVFAKVRLGLDAEGLGMLLACNGFGGIVGSVTVAALGDFRCKGGVFAVCTAVWGALWAAFALSSSIYISFPLIAVIGFSVAPFGVLQTTLLLMMTDREVHGRVMGIQELTIGIMPLAAILIGIQAEIFGISAVAVSNGLLLVVSIAVIVCIIPALLRYSGRLP